jgi:hypothetical protein
MKAGALKTTFSSRSLVPVRTAVVDSQSQVEFPGQLIVSSNNRPWNIHAVLEVGIAGTRAKDTRLLNPDDRVVDNLESGEEKKVDARFRV